MILKSLRKTHEWHFKTRFKDFSVLPMPLFKCTTCHYSGEIIEGVHPLDKVILFCLIPVYFIDQMLFVTAEN